MLSYHKHIQIISLFWCVRVTLITAHLLIAWKIRQINALVLNFDVGTIFMYFRTWEFTFYACISACGNPPKVVYYRTFFPVEIHESACKLTCGNSLSRSNFHMWKYTKKWVFPHVWKSTIFGVFPQAKMHDLMWISTWGKAYFRRRRFTHTFVYFHMR